MHEIKQARTRRAEFILKAEWSNKTHVYIREGGGGGGGSRVCSVTGFQLWEKPAEFLTQRRESRPRDLCEVLLRLASTSLLLAVSLTPRMTLSVAWLPGNSAATVKEFWGMFRQRHA